MCACDVYNERWIYSIKQLLCLLGLSDIVLFAIHSIICHALIFRERKYRCESVIKWEMSKYFKSLS